MDEDVFGQSNCIQQLADQYSEDHQPTTAEIEASPVAVRADSGKDPWALFMWDAAREVVRVLKMGADKYSARNWEKGMKWSRCYDSAQRHLYTWFQEHEDHDKESGLLHLGHAAWNILVLLAYQLRGGCHLKNDDRPIINETILKQDFVRQVEICRECKKEHSNASGRCTKCMAVRLHAGG